MPILCTDDYFKPPIILKCRKIIFFTKKMEAQDLPVISLLWLLNCMLRIISCRINVLVALCVGGSKAPLRK